MDTFIIQGGRKLRGSIPVMGAKNAAGPILAATTLIAGECTLHNVPKISDILMMLSILESMGARVSWIGDHSVTVNCENLDPEKIDYKLVSKIRLSVLFIGCLAQRFGKMRISIPGGCNIGSRPLDAHFEALRKLGYRCDIGDDYYLIERDGSPSSVIVMKEFSVTATENVLLAAVLQSGVREIKCCAAEHVVQDLCWFLNAAGANIQGIGSHVLHITGVSELKSVEYTIMPDPIEAGTFMVLAAATHSEIRIENAAPEFLTFELSKFEEAGLSFTFEQSRRDPQDHYTICTIVPHKVHALQALKKLNVMPYPGFAADLIQPFGLLMTQAQGISLLHDWMFDGRMRYAGELQKMGANMTILDPHRIVIVGPTPLYGKEITSYDLRAGATLVMAGLIAEGTTTIHGIDQVDRGYEKLDERLRALGADIQRAE